MHEMQTIVTDVSGVCLSVCLSCGSAWLHCAKMAEQIKILFGLNTLGDLRNIVLDSGPDPLTARVGVFNAAFIKLLWPLVGILCHCS